MSGTVRLGPGAWLSLDGAAVEVISLDGATVTVRDAAGKWQAVGTAALLARAFLDVPETAPPPAGLLLAGLDAGQREAVSERARHVREMLTGYRSGSAQAARPGEPCQEFARSASVADREQAKAAELGVTTRTVRRWARAYWEGGEAALVDERKTAGRGQAVDERWEDACRAVLAGRAGESTPTAGAVLRQVAARLEKEHGPGTVPLPYQASAYCHLARIAKGTNAVRSSAKRRRSIADLPKGAYGRAGVAAAAGRRHRHQRQDLRSVLPRRDLSALVIDRAGVPELTLPSHASSAWRSCGSSPTVASPGPSATTSLRTEGPEPDGASQSASVVSVSADGRGRSARRAVRDARRSRPCPP